MVDGQDATAVYEITRTAVELARKGGGPSLIEAKTYRFDEHQVGLNIIGEPYRPDAEVQEQVMNRDPVALFRQALLAGGCSEDEIRTVELEAADAVSRAVEFAESSALPEAKDVYQNMYVTPINYPPVH
jgi:TPP-dependent pyruvate/acetoin dehydrogenase alpha subunit